MSTGIKARYMWVDTSTSIGNHQSPLIACHEALLYYSPPAANWRPPPPRTRRVPGPGRVESASDLARCPHHGILCG